MTDRITLADAAKANRLAEFAAQEEARGIGPIDRADFDRAVAKLVTAPQSADRTSRSASAGNSTGKRIRLGSGQGA